MRRLFTLTVCVLTLLVYSRTSHAQCRNGQCRVPNGVSVRAPFAAVDVGPGGVSVRAPFVRVDVPADCPIHEHPTILGMHKHTQDYRARRNLFRQEIDPELCKDAQRWAQGMRDRSVENRRWNYTTSTFWRGTQIHVSHDPRWIRTGGGENTGCGMGGANYSRLAGFEESPGHRQTMLKPYRKVGYGYANARINGRVCWFVCVRYR